MFVQILTKCLELFPELFKSNQNQLTAGSGNGQSLAITEEKSAPDWAVRQEGEEEGEKVVKEVVGEVGERKGGETEVPSRPDQSLAVARSPSDLKAEKLNYEAIQEELSGHSVRAKVLLMQALRWVTRSSSVASIIWRYISVSDKV